jgi:hypothetical protein
MESDKRSFSKLLSGFKLMPIVSKNSFSQKQSITITQTVGQKTTFAPCLNGNLVHNVCFKHIPKPFKNTIFKKLRHLNFLNMHTNEIQSSRIVAFKEESTVYLNGTLHAKNNYWIQLPESFDSFSRNKVERTQLPDYEIIYQN